MAGNDKLKVTILSGFLGSGKTTLLQHLLQSNHGLKIAVIVQDMASINIDAGRIRRVNEEAKMIELQNGCICCSLREELLVEVKKIAEQKEFDYLLVESTGMAEPLHVAEAFTFEILYDPLQNKFGILSDIAQLDCMVTVVDVKQFFDYFLENEDTLEKWSESEDEGKVNFHYDNMYLLCTLIMNQIEFANIILLNKTDLVSEEEIEKVHEFVKSLNTEATIFRTQYCNVESRHVINTGIFDFQEAQGHTAWLKELRGKYVAKSRKYGMNSFIYEYHRPFSNSRLYRLFESKKLQEAGLIRSKGALWLDSSYHRAIDFDICGVSTEVQRNSWHPHKFTQARTNNILRELSGQNCDRRHEIVIIGRDMEKSKIKSLFSQCLITDEELSESKSFTSSMGNHSSGKESSKEPSVMA